MRPRWQPVRASVTCTCGCESRLTAPAVALFWPFRAGYPRQVLSRECAKRLYGFEYVPAGENGHDPRALRAGAD